MADSSDKRGNERDFDARDQRGSRGASGSGSRGTHHRGKSSQEGGRGGDGAGRSSRGSSSSARSSYDDRPGQNRSSRSGGDARGTRGNQRGSSDSSAYRGRRTGDNDARKAGWSDERRSSSARSDRRPYRSNDDSGSRRDGASADRNSRGPARGSTSRPGAGRAGGENYRGGAGRRTSNEGERRSSSGAGYRGGDRRRDGSGGTDGRGASRDGERRYDSRGAAGRGGARQGDRPYGARDNDRRGGSRDGRGREGRDERRSGPGGGLRGGRDQVRRDDRRSARDDGSRRGDRTTVRPVSEVPEIPEEISIGQLDRTVRARLRTLSKDNAEDVGRHLVMAGMLLEIDPERAYTHAQVAVARAGRVDVVREAGAVAAYATGRYAEALREFRTVRRLNGSNEHLALMADCERGLGRPERAIALGREGESAGLDAKQRAELDVVVAGARMDLGENEAAYVALGRVQAPDEETQHHVDAARALALRAMGRTADAEAIEATLPAPTEVRDPWADDVTLYDVQELPDPDVELAESESAGDLEDAAEPAPTENVAQGTNAEAEDK